MYGNLQADFPKKQYQGFNKVHIFDKEDKKQNKTTFKGVKNQI